MKALETITERRNTKTLDRNKIYFLKYDSHAIDIQETITKSYYERKGLSLSKNVSVVHNIT